MYLYTEGRYKKGIKGSPTRKLGVHFQKRGSRPHTSFANFHVLVVISVPLFGLTVLFCHWNPLNEIWEEV
jgi:hypothetical protein